MKYEDNDGTRVLFAVPVFVLQSTNTVMQYVVSAMHFVYLAMQLMVLIMIVYIYWNRHLGIWTFSFEYFNTPFGDLRAGAQYSPVSSATCADRSAKFLGGGGSVVDYITGLLK
jgi:hypothetical protein